MSQSKGWAISVLLALGCTNDLRDDGASAFGDDDDDAGATATSSPGDGDGTGLAGTGGDGDTSGDDDGPKLDVPPPDLPEGCDVLGTAFSFIWIANSAEGTVSKIDTESAQEVARYHTRPDDLPPDIQYALRGPSRTSVNLAGDMAVVNRDEFGAVKIAALEERCVDRNGNGTIETSTGPNDVLPWPDGGPPEDECILWSTDLPMGSRPAAWTSGTHNDTPCGPVWEDMQLWTAAPDPDVAGGARVYLLNGEDGSTIDSISIPAIDCNCAVFGPYGGAVDGDDNLWTFGQDGSDALSGQSWGYGPLIRVDIGEDGIAGHESYAFPGNERAGYGIMVDRDGYPWLAGFNNSLLRFDPEAETFAAVDMSSLPAPFDGDGPTLRGIQQGLGGDLWIAAAFGYPTQVGAGTHGLLRVDPESLTPIEIIDSQVLTGLQLPAGVSIDHEGYVWLVDTLGNAAFKVHPDDHSFERVTGLVFPYTYSDMTGFGLLNTIPPAG